MEQLWVFGIFVLLAIGISVFAIYEASKRRKELAAFAQSIGFSYEPHDYIAGDAHLRYDGFDPFGRGSGRKSTNLLTGQRGEIEFELFDYRFTTGSGKNKSTHRYGIVAAHVPMAFRHLVIRPEGLFDKLAAFAGFDDINFESHEFSSRYHVWCENRQFAYKLIHPRAIEFLLHSPTHHWQIRHGVILIHCRGTLRAGEMSRIIAMIEGFIGLIPPFVREDFQHRTYSPRLT